MASNGSDPAEVRRLWEQGDEVAVHAVDHLNVLQAEAEQIDVTSEILGSWDWIVRQASIPPEAVRGYRAPYLAGSPTQRQILHDANFLYDASVLEFVYGRRVYTRTWPFTMDKGIPLPRYNVSSEEASRERYAGLWEIPVWNLVLGEKKFSMGEFKKNYTAAFTVSSNMLMMHATYRRRTVWRWQRVRG